ncbi:hypothetical protein OEZ85_011705 [Tetradesmus obliquus]|uniref:Uncharacterized protein n=1 Tax=Tetradesmus obliquus TaxID=3088 RepID=A0ABY8TRJ3_TETOB|nr:hypothetical protein OEZ85_011705 [Tetradesmus obliquus]
MPVGRVGSGQQLWGRMLAIQGQAVEGLLVGPESLGAGELAVAQTFDQFEDMLAVAAQLSGGRGRGGRGKSNNLGGGGFSRHRHGAAAAVKLHPGNHTSEVPYQAPAKNQGPRFLLYLCCPGGCCSNADGRSCKTGWDIPDALKYILDQTPELVHPSRCLATSD